MCEARGPRRLSLFVAAGASVGADKALNPLV